MKKLLWAWLTLALVFDIALAAGDKPGDLGLGIIAGNPAGISMKITTSARNSIDLILGYNMNRYDDRYPDNANCCRVGGIVYASADYVWYNYNLIRVCGIRFPVYYGPGVNLVLSHYTSAGVRAVLGLEYQFAKVPFDVFFELAPGLNVTPNAVPGIDGGVGTRYFF